MQGIFFLFFLECDVIVEKCLKCCRSLSVAKRQWHLSSRSEGFTCIKVQDRKLRVDRAYFAPKCLQIHTFEAKLKFCTALTIKRYHDVVRANSRRRHSSLLARGFKRWRRIKATPRFLPCLEGLPYAKPWELLLARLFGLIIAYLHPAPMDSFPSKK